MAEISESSDGDKFATKSLMDSHFKYSRPNVKGIRALQGLKINY